MDKHAGLNPNAHRAFGLEFSQIDDLIKTSPKLVGDLKLIEMCSQSDGACCVIFACEKKAKELSKNPVWIRDHITVHKEETFTIFGYDKKYPWMTTHKVRGGAALQAERHQESAGILRRVRDVRSCDLVGHVTGSGISSTSRAMST